MYQFAYSAICEELPAPASLPSHCHSLPDAIELIDAADRARPASYEQLQVLSDFRRLWLAIANGLLLRASHELPPESRADMLSAAKSVLEEIERRRFKMAGNPPQAGALEHLL